MVRVRTVVFKVLACTVVLVLVPGCSLPHPSLGQTGRVLDWNTKRPVPGAIVLARWEGEKSGLVEAFPVCYHVESVVTDQAGTFHIPAYVETNVLAFDKYVSIRVYKAGYVASIDMKTHRFRGWGAHGLYYLEKDTRSREERLKHLVTIVEASRCNDAGRSKRNFYDFYFAMYKEAKSLAVTPEEKKEANGYKERAMDLKYPSRKVGPYN